MNYSSITARTDGSTDERPCSRPPTFQRCGGFTLPLLRQGELPVQSDHERYHGYRLDDVIAGHQRAQTAVVEAVGRPLQRMVGVLGVSDGTGGKEDRPADPRIQTSDDHVRHHGEADKEVTQHDKNVGDNKQVDHVFVSMSLLYHKPLDNLNWTERKGGFVK